MFRVPEKSPARYVKDLRVSTGSADLETYALELEVTVIDNLLDHGDGYIQPRAGRDIMAQLPNLDSLSLSGVLVPVDKTRLVRIGSLLKRRFGGRLQLNQGYAGRDALNMLLEIPIGLRFTPR